MSADDDDRNAKQTLDLLAAPLRLNADRMHPMPASDGGVDLDQAAEAYAAELGDTVLRHLPARAWAPTATWPRSSPSTRRPTRRAT